MRLDLVDTGAIAGNAPIKAAAPETRRVEHLFTPEQMTFVLQRERARADRHRREFSLVMFRSDDGASREALYQLAKVVVAHARTTDDVGNYDHESICCVMPIPPRPARGNLRSASAIPPNGRAWRPFASS